MGYIRSNQLGLGAGRVVGAISVVGMVSREEEITQLDVEEEMVVGCGGGVGRDRVALVGEPVNVQSVVVGVASNSIRLMESSQWGLGAEGVISVVGMVSMEVTIPQLDEEDLGTEWETGSMGEKIGTSPDSILFFYFFKYSVLVCTALVAV